MTSAEKYSNNVIYQLDSNKIGYFLLGYVKFVQNEQQISIEHMITAMRYGLPKSSIIETIHDGYYLNQLFNQKENWEEEEDENDDLPF